MAEETTSNVEATVREAGGRVTTADGDENFLSNDSVLVSNSMLHEQMLRVLSEGNEAPLPRQEWKND